MSLTIFQMKRQIWVLVACIPQGSLVPSLGLHPPPPSRGGERVVSRLDFDGSKHLVIERPSPRGCPWLPLSLGLGGTYVPKMVRK